MTSVASLVQDQDFQGASPSATDKVPAATLDSQFQVVKAKVNELLMALAVSVRDDNTLTDELVRIRNLHPELAALIASKAGWQPKTAVAVASTVNLTLSGEQTIDGVLTSASRVLVKSQSTPAQNGLYLTGAGAWTRTTDADTAAELGYAFVYVTGGTSQAGTTWVLTQAVADITSLGTTSLSWSLVGGTIGPIPLNKGGTGATTAAAARAALDPNQGDWLVKGTGTSTARSLADRAIDRINVKDLGAVGDGITNDTTAIQNALNKGKTVVFPSGNTFITNSLTVGTAGQSIIVEGGCTIKLANNQNTSLISIGANSVIITGEGTLDGNKANQTSAVFGDAIIKVVGFSGTVVDSLTLINGKYNGFYGKAAPETVIRNCNFSAINDVNIFLHGASSNSRIVHNRIKNGLEDGIKVHSHDGVTLSQVSDGVIVSNNNIDFTGVSLGANVLGIELWGSGGSGLTGCVVSSNVISGGNTSPCFGISLNTCYHTSVTGNTVKNNIGIAYENAEGDYNVFSGNTAKSCVNGLSISNSSHGKSISFTGNNIFSASSYAVQAVNAATSINISGNTFTDCADRVVFLNGVGAGSVISHNIFVSYTLSATARSSIYLLSCPGTTVSGNVMSHQSGSAGGYVITIDSPEVEIIGNKSTAGSAINFNFIFLSASAGRCIVALNKSKNFSFNTVDSASSAGNNLLLGNFNDTGGNPANAAGTDTLANNVQYL